MSVSNILVQQVYTTNGVTTSFAIPFAFLEGEAEDVTKVYTVDLDTGEKTLQTLGVLNDYTLPHDVDTEPANVVFNTAPDNCDVLVTRYLDIEQAIEFINSGQMLLDNIEQGMDILTMIIQQVNEVAQKSVRLNEITSLSTFNPRLPLLINDADSAGKVVVINDTFDGLDLGPTTGDIADAAENAAAAAASADAAANSQAIAAANVIAAAAQAALAAASAAAAAASALAAAAAGSVYTKATFTDGQVATPIVSESFDSGTDIAVMYMYAVIRGTTVALIGHTGMVYKNSVWTKLEMPYAGDYHGLTYSVTQVGTTGTLNVAADIGAGNGTLYLKRFEFTP
jgi:hypothetical protein